MKTFFIIFCLLAQVAFSSERKNKVLVLVIASDNQPVWVKLQKIWRAYMHLDPEHVEAYFIKSDPDLGAEIEIIDDVIWIKASENWIPNILNKTLLSLELLQPRFEEFDYIVRTNLSTFYIFPRMNEFLKRLPLERCYYGKYWDHTMYGVFAQGDGMVISTDLASALAEAKAELWNDPIIDDVRIGMFLRGLGVSLIPAHRIDFPTLENWVENRNFLPVDAFQFRVKNEVNRRERDEIIIFLELLNLFYGVKVL